MKDNEHMMDIRVVQRYIKLKKVSAEDYQKHLDGLEDCAAMAADTETRFVPTYASRNYRD